MSKEYFAHAYCSNSDLTQLARDLSPADAIEYKDAYRLGTLVHTLVLEPHLIDYYHNSIVGHDYTYTVAEIAVARRMRDAVNADPLAAMMKKHCNFEVEMYRENVRFGDVALSCRCKYDAFAPALGYGFDLKSTTATTQQGFINAARRFSYPRGRVFYCTVSGATRDVIIGVSKVAPYRVFKIFMTIGDALWKEGLAECLDLTHKYYMLKPEIV